MSRLVLAVVCCLCFTYTSAETSAFVRAFICRLACDHCLHSKIDTRWCELCGCTSSRTVSSSCSTIRCAPGYTCQETSTRGWLSRSYATCVRQSTTVSTRRPTTLTTTPPPALPVQRACRTKQNCFTDEVCVIPPGVLTGTCKTVQQRTIGKRCLEVMRVGPCRASFNKYFYNSTSQQCQGFYYGGCNGTDNKFDSMESCQKECVEVRTTTEVRASTDAPPEEEKKKEEERQVEERKEEEDPCSHPKIVGMCRGMMERYYYNKSTQKCSLFIYGGCSGNKNNFKTQRECEARCAPEPLVALP